MAASCAGGIGIAYEEWSGLWTTNAVDASANNYGVSAPSTVQDALTSGPCTPTQCQYGGLVWSICGSYSAFEAAGVGTGFRDATTYTAITEFVTEHRRITGNQTVAGTWLANNTGDTYAPMVMVIPEAPSGPIITANPTQQTSTVGGTATFSVSATLTAGSLSYQWYKNGTSIGGATSSSYTTPTLASSDNGSWFECDVTDSNGTHRTVRAGVFMQGLPVSGTGSAGMSGFGFERRGSRRRVDSSGFGRHAVLTGMDTGQLGAALWLDWFLGVASSGSVYSVTLSESGSGADSLIAAYLALGTLAESGSGSDAITSSATFGVLLSEAGTAADVLATLANLTVLLAEAGSAADAEAGGNSPLNTLAEAASGSDVLAALTTLAASLAESGTAADVAAGLLNASNALSEAGSALDVVLGSILALNAIAEAGSAADAESGATAGGSIYTQTLAEAASAIDALVTLATLISVVTETGSGADSVTSQLAGLVALAESGAAADVEIGGTLQTNTLAEAGSAADALSGSSGPTNTLSESGSASDVVSLAIAFLGTLSELGNGSDVLASQQAMLSALAESGIAVDSLAQSLAASQLLIEAGAALDSLTLGGPIAIAIAEAASAVSAFAWATNLTGIYAELERTVVVKSKSARIVADVPSRSIHSTANSRITRNDESAKKSVFVKSNSRTIH